MILEEFMFSDKNRASIRSPGFSRLSVEKIKQTIDGVEYPLILAIPLIRAKNPGSGTFRKFLKEFWTKYHLPIMIQYVATEDFENGLRDMGFVRLESRNPNFPHYFRKPFSQF